MLTTAAQFSAWYAQHGIVPVTASQRRTYTPDTWPATPAAAQAAGQVVAQVTAVFGGPCTPTVTGMLQVVRCGGQLYAAYACGPNQPLGIMRAYKPAIVKGC